MSSGDSVSIHGVTIAIALCLTESPKRLLDSDALDHAHCWIVLNRLLWTKTPQFPRVSVRNFNLVSRPLRSKAYFVAFLRFLPGHRHTDLCWRGNHLNPTSPFPLQSRDSARQSWQIWSKDRCSLCGRSCATYLGVTITLMQPCDTWLVTSRVSAWGGKRNRPSCKQW